MHRRRRTEGERENGKDYRKSHDYNIKEFAAFVGAGGKREREGRRARESYYPGPKLSLLRSSSSSSSAAPPLLNLKRNRHSISIHPSIPSVRPPTHPLHAHSHRERKSKRDTAQQQQRSCVYISFHVILSRSFTQ